MRRGRGVVLGVAVACVGACALVLGFSAIGQARSLEDQIWIWQQQGAATNSQIERMDGRLQNISLFAVANCPDGSQITVPAGLYDGGPIDSSGNFSYSGAAQDDPTVYIDLQGHFGANTLSGTYRLIGPPSYCSDQAPADTGVVPFAAQCYQGCSSGGGGGGGSSFAAPEGNWKVSYPSKFKCGRRTCASGVYDGPARLKATLRGMLPARLALTPRCAKPTCSVDAQVRTRSGKQFKATARVVRSSLGTHTAVSVQQTPIHCGGRRLKVRVIFGLTQVGTGTAAKLTVKELLYVANPSDRPLRCVPLFANASQAYRYTATTRLP